MFLIELTYKVSLAEVEPFMAEHMAFVEKGYVSGHFLASGRKVPRTGGLIICKATNSAEVEELMQADPFVNQNLAELKIAEFVASRAAQDLHGLLES